MDKKKKWILVGILAVCGVVCICYVIFYFQKQKDAREKMEQMREEAKTESVAEPKKEKPKEEPEEEPYVSPIDFEVLKEKNEDIYAWIQIPDTLVDYPIVHSEGEKYLNLTVDGAEGLPGSIFTEEYNTMDFTDYNTVIYGHNMRDGSMFGGLHEYEDKEYQAAHPEIYIYLPDKTLKYEIFAGVEHGDAHLLDEYDFTDAQSRQSFLDDLKNQAESQGGFYLSELVTAEDKLITLSTCVGGKADRRWFVCGVLKEE